MSRPFDASRSLTALEQDSTIIAVIEMSQVSSDGKHPATLRFYVQLGVIPR